MQKARTEMNVQLTNVLSDLSGVKRMRLLRAIVAAGAVGDLAAAVGRLGSRSATDRDLRCGFGSPDEAVAGRRNRPSAPAALPPSKPTGGRQKNGRSSRNQPDFDLSAELKRVTGVDRTRIDGVKEMTIQTILTEAGLDMSKWVSHCVSLGGYDMARQRQLLRGTVPPPAQPTGSPPSDYRRGAKLARLVYRMLKYGQEYVERGAAHYAAKHREQLVRHLQRKAARHGFPLVSIPHSTSGQPLELNILQTSFWGV
jgi:hypothetical protein